MKLSARRFTRCDWIHAYSRAGRRPLGVGGSHQWRSKEDRGAHLDFLGGLTVYYNVFLKKLSSQWCWYGERESAMICDERRHAERKGATGCIYYHEMHGLVTLGEEEPHEANLAEQLPSESQHSRDSLEFTARLFSARAGVAGCMQWDTIGCRCGPAPRDLRSCGERACLDYALNGEARSGKSWGQRVGYEGTWH